MQALISILSIVASMFVTFSVFAVGMMGDADRGRALFSHISLLPDLLHRLPNTYGTDDNKCDAVYQQQQV